jgi:hypothetical protein
MSDYAAPAVYRMTIANCMDRHMAEWRTTKYILGRYTNYRSGLVPPRPVSKMPQIPALHKTDR